EAMRRCPGLPPPPGFGWEVSPRDEEEVDDGQEDQEPNGRETDRKKAGDQAAEDQERACDDPECEDESADESADLDPGDFIVVDTVPLEAGSEGLPPDCLGYLDVTARFRLHADLLSRADQRPDLVVGAVRDMVRRAAERLIASAAGALLDRLPPEVALRIAPQLLGASEDLTWQ
ncbi:MAG: hypothetical protein MUC63_10680, partial [Planctomycetes bacterium]|nr:hypothetical protein [Planctomycetota bacterium]